MLLYKVQKKYFTNIQDDWKILFSMLLCTFKEQFVFHNYIYSCISHANYIIQMTALFIYAFRFWISFARLCFKGKPAILSVKIRPLLSGHIFPSGLIFSYKETVWFYLNLKTNKFDINSFLLHSGKYYCIRQFDEISVCSFVNLNGS